MAKYVWLRSPGDKMEFLFAFPCKLKKLVLKHQIRGHYTQASKISFASIFLVLLYHMGTGERAHYTVYFWLKLIRQQ